MRMVRRLSIAAATGILASGLFMPSASAALTEPHSAACLAKGKTMYGKNGGRTIEIPTTVVQKGSTGVCVRYLQELLRDQGYSITVDGIFGEKTKNAVTSWQKSQKLQVDGIVGKNTWFTLMIID